MGANISQQGCLKLSINQGLTENPELEEEYTFEKEGHRLYMLDTPMDLVSDKWQAIAKIVVTEITIGHKKTNGKYRILKIFTPEEAQAISSTYIPYEKVRDY